MVNFHQQISALIVGAHIEREREREREHTFVLSVKIFINKASAFLLPPTEPFFSAKVPFLSPSVPIAAPSVPFLPAKAPMSAPSAPFLPKKAPTVAPLAPISTPLAHKTLKFFNF